jgi:hypothetical protein
MVFIIRSVYATSCSINDDRLVLSALAMYGLGARSRMRLGVLNRCWLSGLGVMGGAITGKMDKNKAMDGLHAG